MSRLGEEMREREIDGASNLGQRVQGRDGVPVLNPGEVAAQKACALFDVTLGHALLQPIVSDGLTDVHRESNKSKLPRIRCILTRVVSSGKKNFVAPELVMECIRELRVGDPRYGISVVNNRNLSFFELGQSLFQRACKETGRVLRGVKPHRPRDTQSCCWDSERHAPSRGKSQFRPAYPAA